MAIVRTPNEILVSSNLRQDLRRRTVESAGVLMLGGAIYLGAHLLGYDPSPFRAHFLVAALLPWVAQLILLPNSVGAAPFPSFTIRITADFVALERYGVEMHRIARPISFAYRRWWSPFEGATIRGARHSIHLPPHVFEAHEWRTLESLLSDRPVLTD